MLINIRNQLQINNQVMEVNAPPSMPLLWLLRDKLNLTGTKYGCGHGACGACVVEIDGSQVHSCQVTAAQVAGKKITTIEGQTDEVAKALFAAWLALDVAQCGFCQPAQINSAHVLLTHNPHPSDADIDAAMQHNLCRCATYQRVRKAIHQAAASLTAAIASGDASRLETTSAGAIA